MQYMTPPPFALQPYRRLSFSLPLLEALELVEVAVWEHVDLSSYLVGVAACGPEFTPGGSIHTLCVSPPPGSSSRAPPAALLPPPPQAASPQLHMVTLNELWILLPLSNATYTPPPPSYPNACRADDRESAAGKQMRLLGQVPAPAPGLEPPPSEQTPTPYSSNPGSVCGGGDDDDSASLSIKTTVDPPAATMGAGAGAGPFAAASGEAGPSPGGRGDTEATAGPSSSGCFIHALSLPSCRLLHVRNSLNCLGFDLFVPRAEALFLLCPQLGRTRVLVSGGLGGRGVWDSEGN